MQRTRRIPAVAGRPGLAVVALTALLGLSGCGSSKTYDIGVIFPASDPATKCAKYDGDLQGSGPLASCLVTKDECEKAAADWDQAMKDSYVTDAIKFSC